LKQATEYFALARERESIRLKRLANQPLPWTNNPILRQWRFTNVHREHDRTTIWLREHLREKLDGLRLIEATLIFRWFNRIETGERVEDLLLNGWDSEEARRRLIDAPKLVTGAYIVRSPWGVSKLEGLLACIDSARSMLPAMVEHWGDSLQAAWQDLTIIPYMGKFTSGEVVIDLRFTPVLNQAYDVNSWTVAGPGCARGLGLVVAGDAGLYDYNSEKHQVEMLAVMIELLAMSKDPQHWPVEWDPWELHECEMWACEWAKYQSAMAGNRLKRKYPCAS
jgi:hypothetical protein